MFRLIDKILEKFFPKNKKQSVLHHIYLFIKEQTFIFIKYKQ
jgi:hypothetical protein